MTMGLSNYAEQILNIYNYYNGAIMVNRRGMIEYYYNNRKDINTLTEKRCPREKPFRNLFQHRHGEQHADGSDAYRPSDV